MEDLYQRRLVLLSSEGNDLAVTGVLPMITMMLLRMQPQTLQQVVEVITHHHGLVNRNVGFAHLRKRIKETCVEFPVHRPHCQQTCMITYCISQTTISSVQLCTHNGRAENKTCRQVFGMSGIKANPKDQEED